MKTKTLILSVLMLTMGSLASRAQWAVGLSAGWDHNSPSIDRGYATDVQYKGQNGFNVGLVGRYQFLDWIAVRADLRVSTRNYKMQRNLDYLGYNQIYTDHTDTYLHLPVTADFSVGGAKLRGHFYLGGYVGRWMAANRSGLTDTGNDRLYAFDEDMDFDSNRDRRFNAGVTAGLGLSYLFNKHIEVMAESFYMYDLTKSNKTSSVIAYPRYNNTAYINLAFMYNF